MTDLAGRRIPQRIVSLVPSLTEALFSLGLGDRVVGVTEYCVHPAEGVAGCARVGGTKNPDIDAIAALAPDLVIANHEENTERAVRMLEARALEVWVTYPRTVRDGVELLGELAELGASAEDRERIVAPVQAALSEAEAQRPYSCVRVFCPIWRDPWMAVGENTYAHDLLSLCGGENVFAKEGDRRYPVVDLEAIVRSAPEVILLPDEPFAFGPEDAAELGELQIPAARHGRIHLIDGTLVSWYGPRIESALRVIRPLLTIPR